MTEATTSADSSVITWWILLSSIAVINLGLITWVYFIYKKKKQEWQADIANFRKWQFIMAAIYTAGCAFRSFFPRGDVDRVVLYDGWVSLIAIGRSVATIAELAFVVQWTLILLEAKKFTGDKKLYYLALPIVPLIVLAEMCSWYGVLTQNTIGQTLEETLWALTAAITVVGLLIALPRYSQKQRFYLTAGSVLGIMFVIYMAVIDVPTYYNKYLAGEMAGMQYLTLAEGWRQVTTTYTHTLSYETWKYAMVWMTGYFSMAVWMSMYMVVAPSLDKNLVQK